MFKVILQKRGKMKQCKKVKIRNSLQYVYIFDIIKLISLCLQSSLHIFFLNTLTWHFIICQLKSLELGPNICANFRNIQSNMALVRSDILSVQFRYSVESKSLQASGPKHSGLPYPSLTSRACSNSCSLMVMPFNHLIFCCPLCLPSIFPIIRVFSSESLLCIRWPNYWSFSFSISPSNEYSGLFPLGWTGLISLQSKGLSRVFLNYTVEKH